MTTRQLRRNIRTLERAAIELIYVVADLGEVPGALKVRAVAAIVFYHAARLAQGPGGGGGKKATRAALHARARGELPSEVFPV